MNKKWKVILIVTGLICGLALVYSIVFSLVILPSRKEANRKILEEQKVEQEKMEQEKVKTGGASLDNCLGEAEINYIKSWDDECESLGLKSKECISLEHMSLNEYMEQNPNPNKTLKEFASDMSNERDNKCSTCKLPTKISDNLNTNFKYSKDECYRRYPIK